MEFHNLGKNCSISSCKQLDFLPIICPHCSLMFCKEHYMPDRHNCAKTDIHTCDFQNSKATNLSIKCSSGGCNSTSVVPPCTVCHQCFCIVHRHHGCLDKTPSEEDIKRWNAPREQFIAAKNAVDQQVSSCLQEKASKKGNITAMKVQLMRLKSRAMGPSNVPMAERSYFLVSPPLQCSLQSRAVFVGRHWTLGRVIDSVADTFKIPNRNNEVTAPKLRLFNCHSGQELGLVSKTVQTLLDENSLCDGSSVILEYVPSKNVKNDSLIDISLYQE